MSNDLLSLDITIPNDLDLDLDLSIFLYSLTKIFFLGGHIDRSFVLYNKYRTNIEKIFT